MSDILYDDYRFINSVQKNRAIEIPYMRSLSQVPALARETLTALYPICETMLYKLSQC